MDRQQQISRILQAARTRAVPERTAFLADTCAGDDELRRHVSPLADTTALGHREFLERRLAFLDEHGAR